MIRTQNIPPALLFQAPPARAIASVGAAGTSVDRVELSQDSSEFTPVNFRQMLALSKSDQSRVDRPVGETASIRLPGLDKVWAQGFTGKGQTIAIIDSGFFPHADIKDRVVGYVDLASGKEKLSDNWGHGTHVAGIVAGSGKKSDGQVKGVAPEANLVGVRIGSMQQAIDGLRWVIAHKEELNIGVVNISLGEVATQSYKDDPWCQAVEDATKAGLTVVVAAGNEGDRGAGSVSTPGISPSAITVGGVDDQGTVDPSDDTRYIDGSFGPTVVDKLVKPDVMAPAISIFSTLSPSSGLDDPTRAHIGKDYMTMAGTSMATPAVAGLVALLKQARPDLAPADLKKILQQSVYHGQQNLPIVQADAALELAKTYKAA
ncbi:MAG: S8 family peptidase [Candidatus Eremiobacteraeota bacterium]|nr:S8 family peptidase [Candidatus Eremiobacteraeota bacterium]